MEKFAALVAGFGLGFMIFAAMRTTIDDLRGRALVAALGLILLIVGVAML